jgi:hypothetical protein
MRLKFLTTGFLILGMALMFAYPFVIGPRPTPAPSPESGLDKELARWATRSLAMVGVICMVLLVAALCAVLLIRQNKRKYLDEHSAMVRDLVEGSLNDHNQSRT